MNRNFVVGIFLLVCFGGGGVTVAQKNELPLEDQLRKRLVAGDITALPELVESQPLQVLYGFLRLADTHQFGDNSPRVLATVAEAIKKIPGHGKYIGDKIEVLSSERLSGRKRDKLFSALSNVASDESIEQCGRFLFDERDPDLAAGLSPRDGILMTPNSYLAATALGTILGDKSPAKRRKPGDYGGEEIALIQKWWKENHPTPPQPSGAGSAPSPAPEAPSTKGKSSQDSSQETKPREDAVISEAPSWVWMVAGAATIAGSGLTLLRAKRQRR